jgi:hypothetical protein
VVLGLDDAVGGAALAGDVTADCEEKMSACCSGFLSARLCVYVCLWHGLFLSLEGALWVRDGRTGFKE